ncbi:MAG: polyhydroxybutyrate depolymerase [Pseudomonadota bacterium]
MKMLLASALIALSCLATHARACGLETACPLPGSDRSYHVRAPDNWDGKTPLPVLLHFHGWGRQGKLIMNHSRIAGATRPAGVLLVAPNGEGRTWKIWQANSPDVDFADAVLAHVATRFPLDQKRLFVSGYSYGSVMAWRYACARGAKINTVLAISGSFRERDKPCTAPVNMIHVHGTSDGVMAYPYGEAGTEESAVDLWLNRNGCADKADARENWQAVEILPFERHVWNRCSTGKRVVLDVHRRGHFIPRFWIARQLRDLL